MGKINRMRQLIERLPGPTNWMALAKFTIIQTGNCKTFVQQCLNNSERVPPLRRPGHCKRDANTSDKGALAEALVWQPLGCRFHYIITCVYLYMLIKYRLVSFMSDAFGYLDCLIMGRFRFIGRTNKISGEIISIFIACFFIYRWTIHLYVPQFKFFALEFLISDPEARHPISEARRRASLMSSQMSDTDNERGVSSDKKNFREQFYCMNRHKRPPEDEVNSNVYLKNPFEMQEDRWFLRPNRTRKSWLTLSLWTKFMLYYSVYILILWIFAWYMIMGGSIITNLGFEMSYPNCVSWLRNIQSAPQPPNRLHQFNNYSHFYLASRVLAHEIPIDDIPARIPLDTRDLQKATLYTILRITVDTLDNLVIYIEFIATFLALFYLLAINSLDVILNANAIRARLLELLVKLETQMNIRYQEKTRDKCYSSFIAEAQKSEKLLSVNSHDRKMPSNTSTASWTSNHAHQFPRMGGPINRFLESLDQQLLDETVELQAILADHFYTITRGYNLYVTFSLSLFGLSWILYTATICIWMNTIKSRAIELEFVITEINITIFGVALTIGAAFVRSHNLQLYSLITRAMALDTNYELTKSRWISILNYYYPKPFHCFTIFGSTEISVLLGLKIISWILSAFIVLANFFYKNTI